MKLQQLQEVVYIKTRLLQNVRQRRTFDRAVGWHGDLERFASRMFLQADMTALLAHNRPTVSLQSADDLLIRQAGHFHSSTSWSKALSPITKSSSTGSRYNAMASWMFFKASSTVSPSLMQPGKDGT